MTLFYVVLVRWLPTICKSTWNFIHWEERLSFLYYIQGIDYHYNCYVYQVYLCLHLFTPVYLRLPLFTHVYLCLPLLIAHVYLCLNNTDKKKLLLICNENEVLEMLHPMQVHYLKFFPGNLVIVTKTALVKV